MAEGCEILPLKAPVRIETHEDGTVRGLVVQPQVIGEVKGGRPAPRNANVPEEFYACDVVLMAVGQAVDSAVFAENGVPTKRNNIITADDGSVPGWEGVFSGGDCVSGPATVILAVEARQGRRRPVSTSTWASTRIFPPTWRSLPPPSA